MFYWWLFIALSAFVCIILHTTRDAEDLRHSMNTGMILHSKCICMLMLAVFIKKTPNFNTHCTWISIKSGEHNIGNHAWGYGIAVKKPCYACDNQSYRCDNHRYACDKNILKNFNILTIWCPSVLTTKQLKLISIFFQAFIWSKFFIKENIKT